MKKSTQLNAFAWRWHFIAGLISLPFILLLSSTGMIYMFKDNIEQYQFESIKKISVQHNASKKTFDQQLQSAQQLADISTVFIPQHSDDATRFAYGRFATGNVYVNPYTAQVTGQINNNDTSMQSVRKLHGELLLGKFGTKIVELVASWLLILILTGLFLWWPKNKFALKGLFTIRFNQGKRLFFRDFHAVVGFWISIILLVILSGGLPWSDYFGKNFSNLQKLTNSGYPENWFESQGLTSTIQGAPLNIDQMIEQAKSLNLAGEVSITLPDFSKSVWRVQNTANNLRDQKVIHLDQYTGNVIKTLNWSDVGFMAQARQVTMRLHQGEFFGFLNWLIILVSALLLALSSLSILAAYLMRKPQSKLGLPKVPEHFKISKLLWILILSLAFILPMFGFSLIFIVLIEWILKLKNKYKKINS